MSKLRTDSWAANLTEEQAWALYYKSQTLRWFEAAEWVANEYGVRKPSRSAFDAWRQRMRKEESAHRLERAAVSAAEAAALAKTQGRTEAQVGAYRAMAAELALRTNSAEEAQRFVQMASTIVNDCLREQELKLKTRAQSTKDEQLKLAREKFEAAEKRLERVAEVTGDLKLTPEEKLKELDRLFGR